MGRTTGISWAERTWNPTVGCSLVSPGCTHCYAMAQAHWIAAQGGKAGAKYEGLTTLGANGHPVWNGVVRMADAAVLDIPRRWKAPARIFVDSMSDCFHESLRDEDVFKILDVMVEADQHVYEVLTKRPARMAELLEAYMTSRKILRLEHIWVGTSVEDQKRLEERVPHLARIRAAVRWISAEPLLGPLDFGKVRLPGGSNPLPLDWVVVGGESITREMRAAGEHARVFDVAWARQIRDWCAGAGAKFHFKQLGENPTGWRKTTAKGDSPGEWPDDLRIQEYPLAA